MKSKSSPRSRATASVALVCVLSSLGACSATPGEESSTGAGAGYESVQEALSQGIWRDFANGEVPSDAARRGNLVVCAVLHSDGVFHPGKVWDGGCYYGWGGSEYHSRTYKVLINKPGYAWVPSAGVTPANAVAGPMVNSTQLPVCSTTDGGALGKVWIGKCHFGWNGREERHDNFDFLVDTTCHSPCTQGGPLSSSCGSCEAKVCTADSFCCTTRWDGICVQEARTMCGLGC